MCLILKTVTPPTAILMICKFKFFHFFQGIPQNFANHAITLAKKNDNFIWQIWQFFVVRMVTLAINDLCHFLWYDGQANTATMSLQVITFTKNNAFWYPYQSSVLVTSGFMKLFVTHTTQLNDPQSEKHHSILSYCMLKIQMHYFW